MATSDKQPRQDTEQQPSPNKQNQHAQSTTSSLSPSSDRSPKKAAPKRGKWLKRGCLVGVLLISAGMMWMGNSLNQMVTEKFEGQLWQLPSVVYARELTLQPGAMIRYEDLVNELEVLNYRKVASPKKSGEYSTSRLKVDFIRRPFEFRDGGTTAEACGCRI